MGRGREFKGCQLLVYKRNIVENSGSHSLPLSVHQCHELEIGKQCPSRIPINRNSKVTYPHKKKSKDVMSGDLGDHGVGRPLPIQRLAWEIFHLKPFAVPNSSVAIPHHAGK
ncbi:hypothetical protein AVEN_70580-1 [Araneus ventricosus]|uniref:Uncharacterized protein n=1 Tax=Araneus ventricosus TaxID=182803 RepID=A0A4Y2CHD8_ARAVE|nr:hypothetical protein AVEN_70580-1 [Araneus ventricosus]